MRAAAKVGLAAPGLDLGAGRRGDVQGKRHGNGSDEGWGTGGGGAVATEAVKRGPTNQIVINSKSELESAGRLRASRRSLPTSKARVVG